MKNFINLVIILSLLVGCKREPQNSHKPVEKQTYTLSYATTFALDSVENQLRYTIKNKNTEKTLSIDYNRLPFKSIVTTSSSAVAYLDALGQTDKIKAAYDTDWIYSPTLQEQIADKTTQSLGNSNGIDLEQLLLLKPDAIVVFSDPNKVQLFKQLEENGIQVIYVDEYLEQTPLGKAEYIKFFGILTGEYKKANALFNTVEKEYKALSHKAKSVENKPTILANIMRGDIWYLPGGKSFSAQLFQDAGGQYLWKDDDTEGSIHLDFEEVFNKAENADYWLNASDFKTLDALGNAYKNHHWFKAFKAGNVYSFAKRTNAKGANDFFETGTVRPDLVLKDLIAILHPEVLPNHELYFYQKLE